MKLLETENTALKENKAGMEQGIQTLCNRNTALGLENESMKANQHAAESQSEEDKSQRGVLQQERDHALKSQGEIANLLLKLRHSLGSLFTLENWTGTQVEVEALKSLRSERKDKLQRLHDIIEEHACDPISLVSLIDIAQQGGVIIAAKDGYLYDQETINVCYKKSWVKKASANFTSPALPSSNISKMTSIPNRSAQSFFLALGSEIDKQNEEIKILDKTIKRLEEDELEEKTPVNPSSVLSNSSSLFQARPAATKEAEPSHGGLNP
jgi:flagellar biosynthesis chaperone FliJ